MPDALPAHGDIVVHEYLDFFARAFGVRQPARSQILGEIEDFTGLGPPPRENPQEPLQGHEATRQPRRAPSSTTRAVLILDEPASGLDPHAQHAQLPRAHRRPRRERGKAVLLCSHVLPEVEEMVDDVIIVQRGRVIRAGAIDAIAHGEADPAAPNGTNAAATPGPAAARRILVRLLSGHEDFPALAALQPGVTACRARGSRAFELDIEADDQGTAALLQSLVAAGVPLVEFRMASGGLERMFLEATRGNGSAT
jgi:ABC-2 type transport system ATP-binding protein